MHVAVVGGGAVGVTLAHDLAPDATVTLYEADSVASGATGRAAGLCYDAFSDRRDARIARRALVRFREADALTDCPYVWLARDTGEDRDARRASEIREQAALMRDRGVDATTLDGAELGERFPALVTDDVAVAAVAESAGHVDPGRYTTETADRARERGVEIRENTPAEVTAEGDIATDDGIAGYDAVVVAAGAHTRAVVSDVAPIPVKPYRVQALVTDPVERELPMLFDASGGYYLRSREGGILVGDGTLPEEQDPDDWTREADDWFRADATGYQERALGESWPEARSWAGLCTATPDGDPLVGELQSGVYVATGWQGHGFMRAPAIAERLAAQVLGEEWSAFDPTRFGGDESFEIVEGMDVERR
ncbi:NAD(P)/FAD-dependent oxidoreductase [Halosegnis longus]|uniref:FAD-binding oxidoreductase n=1 Tax=Halosegnis longus TaxID=2216012 RepID=A0AAJ4UX28_9EURY|nr:FAD-dependent oxidoreductase [Halosegnis longus]RNJ27530.1 FAD-binding oxidoreductase [Salella cibi]